MTQTHNWEIDASGEVVTLHIYPANSNWYDCPCIFVGCIRQGREWKPICAGETSSLPDAVNGLRLHSGSQASTHIHTKRVDSKMERKALLNKLVQQYPKLNIEHDRAA